MKFSLLMSIYHKENAEYFERCMRSIWMEQSVKPDEIVLVIDGVLTTQLYEKIAWWKSYLKDLFRLVELEKNVGLGRALNIGLTHCRYDIVARMDTDDISMPDRFQKQLHIMEDPSIDICGSWISEFDTDETQIHALRKVPQTHMEIIQFSKRRNPMNHPSVMYRKAKVEQAGGYRNMLWFEDYYLWIRMLLSGALFYNIPEALVHMRAGEAQLQRRRGIRYTGREILFQYRILKLHHITPALFVQNVTLRSAARLLPASVTQWIYKQLRR